MNMLLAFETFAKFVVFPMHSPMHWWWSCCNSLAPSTGEKGVLTLFFFVHCFSHKKLELHRNGIPYVGMVMWIVSTHSINLSFVFFIRCKRCATSTWPGTVNTLNFISPCPRLCLCCMHTSVCQSTQSMMLGQENTVTFSSPCMRSWDRCLSRRY